MGSRKLTLTLYEQFSNMRHLPALKKLSFNWRQYLHMKKGLWDRNWDVGPRTGLSAWKWKIQVQRSAQNNVQKPYQIRDYCFGAVSCRRKWIFVCQSWFHLCESFNLHFWMLYYSTSLFTISGLYSASIHPHFKFSSWQERPIIPCNLFSRIVKHFPNMILQCNILVKQYYSRTDFCMISPMP